MSLLKDLFKTAQAISEEVTDKAQKSVKPYLPLAAELYNELASRVFPKLPKVDVDRLLEDLYPRVDMAPTWEAPVAPPVAPAPPAARAEAVVKPTPKPAAKPAPKPAAKPAPKPAAKPAPKPAAKPVAVAAPAKKAAAAKRPAAKKATEKEAVAKKPAAKKATDKKAVAKKPAAKKAVEKAASKKTEAKKAVARKPAAKKTATKKAVAKKATPKVAAKTTDEKKTETAAVTLASQRKATTPKRRIVPSSRATQTTLIEKQKSDPEAVKELMKLTKAKLVELAKDKKVKIKTNSSKMAVAEAIAAKS